ncbi:MAG: Jag N-terminal domain-containing protein [Synergistaceae bacterium]|nr:Jag N-terminal domain-containing protein [Synergistaceae bacterium]
MSFENEEGAHKARERREERERRRAEQKLVFEVSDVNEALELASKEWEIDAKSLKAEVLSSERGFLGLFGNKLKVEVTPVKPLLHLKATRLANDLLSLMGMDAAANLRDDGTIEIEGADAADYIIGHYGDALKSIEYLLNLILRDPSFEPRLRIDCCGYRERRTRSLERLAEATARQALDYGRPIRLDPMLSWERWVIHTALKNRDDVRTESVGEPPLRKVVIMPRFDAESGGLANPNYNSNRRGGRFSAGRSDRNYNSNSRRSSSRFSSSRSEHSYSSRRSRDGSERPSRDFDFRDDKNFRDISADDGEPRGVDLDLKNENLYLENFVAGSLDNSENEIFETPEFERDDRDVRDNRPPRPYFGRSGSRSRSRYSR